MQLIPILIAAFAILANAQRYQPQRYQYQQKRAAQVVGSGTDSGSDSGSGSGNSSGTTGNDASNPASSAPQSSITGTSTTNSVSISNPTSSSSSSNAMGSTASFTQYSPCSDPHKTSCAWYSSTGYNAAISQAVYGGSPGSGPSGACGICWKLTPDHAGANEIVVKVNNLCPDEGNPLCAQAESEISQLYPRSEWNRIRVADYGVYFFQMSISISTCARTAALRRPFSAVRGRSRLMGRRLPWIAPSGVAGLIFVCRA